MATKVIVDTNILFDLFFKTSDYEKAVKVLSDKNIFVYKGVLEELFVLLKNRSNSEIASNVVTYILNRAKKYKVLDCDVQELGRALATAQYHQANDSRKNLSLVDAVQIVLASREDCIVITQEERMSFFDGVEKVY